MKDHLIFDATDANTIADTDSVGAFVRASDGTLITHHDVSGNKGLDTYILNASLTIDDGGSSITVDAVDLDIRDLSSVTDSVSAVQSGTWTIDSITNDVSIDDGGNSITVDAVDLDIRDLAFATDSVTAHQGGTWTIDSITNDVNIADGGNSITVDAIDLDIRDLSAASDSVQSNLFDGSGTALTSTLVGADQALDVNVVGGVNVEVDLSHIDDSIRLGDGTSFFTSSTIGSDIGLDVNVINDPSSANTAILSSAKALTAAGTAEKVVSANLAARKYLFVYNMDNRKAYIGGSGVDKDNGFPLSPGSYMQLQAGAAVDVYFDSEINGHDIRNLELS